MHLETKLGNHFSRLINPNKQLMLEVMLSDKRKRGNASLEN